MNITIIGGSFAGTTAALAARTTYPDASIYLIDKQADIGFLPSGLQLYLNHLISELNEAHFMTKEILIAADIQLLLETEVTATDTINQQLTCLRAKTTYMHSYDKLIIATGSEQQSSLIDQNHSDTIIHSKTLAQSRLGLQTIINSEKIAIIGGGHVGLEMASALANHSKKITFFESMDGLLLKYFDHDIITPLLTTIESQGIELKLSESVTHCESLENELVISTSKDEYHFDAAVFSLSVFPRLPFLDSSIQCHQDNTIQVNRYLETTAKNVFAIGDCIQITHSLDDSSTHVPLINNAIRTAEVVVTNLLNPTTPFIGSLRTIGTKVFGYYLASTGLTEEESIFYPDEVASNIQTIPINFLKPTATLTGKLVYNKSTQQVLGAQLISKEPILDKIDTLALAIQAKLTLADLRQKDYFFQPAFSPLLSATNSLGALKKDVTSNDA